MYTTLTLTIMRALAIAAPTTTTFFRNEQLETTAGERTSAPAYVRQVQEEHRAIMDAIAKRDSDAARDAMRVHLKGSHERYRKLIEPSA